MIAVAWSDTVGGLFMVAGGIVGIAWQALSVDRAQRAGRREAQDISAGAVLRRHRGKGAA